MQQSHLQHGTFGPERKHLPSFVAGVTQKAAPKLTYSLKVQILYFTVLLHSKKPGEGLIPEVFGLGKKWKWVGKH